MTRGRIYEASEQKMVNRHLRPLLIGGAGRSGTTILKRVLSTHPQIVSLRDELRIITDPDGALSLESALTENWSQYSGDIAIHRFRELINDCCRGGNKLLLAGEKVERRIFRRAGISPRRYLGAGFSMQFGREQVQSALDRLTSEVSFHRSRGSWAGSKPYQLPAYIYESEPLPSRDVRSAISRFIETLYSGLPLADEASLWLDDSPPNLVYVDRLLRLFPDMRFIHIYRDPRDVLSSYLGFAWGGDDVEAVSRRLAAIFCRWEEIKQALPNDMFVELSLEKLSHSPKGALKDLCAFIGIEYDEKLEEVSLDKVNAGRWQSDLSSAQKKLAEKYLGKYLQIYTQ